VWRRSLDHHKTYSFVLSPAAGSWKQLRASVQARDDDEVVTEKHTLRWDSSGCRFVADE
jgi:hypothetical protein